MTSFKQQEKAGESRTTSFLPLDDGKPIPLVDELFEEIGEELSAQRESTGLLRAIIPFPRRIGKQLSPIAGGPTASAPESRSKTWSILDLACRATSPSGMPLILVPLYRVMYGMMLRISRRSISATTTKAIVTIGALFGITTLWKLVVPSLRKYFSCSMTFPIEHQIARRTQAWLATHVKGKTQRHTAFLSGRMQFNKNTRETEWAGDLLTAITEGWFWFDGNPIYFEFLNRTPDMQETVVAYDDEGYYPDDWQVKPQMIRISTPGWSKAVLQRFIDHISEAKAVEKNITVVFEVGPGKKRLLWQHQLRPSRPISTIDLDQRIKEDLIADIDHFMLPERVKWYGDRGIPYRRGYMFFGPPGTGKTSVSHALAGRFRSSLYMVSMNEIEDEQHMKKLFRTPTKGDILLLEDIDSAGIMRETMRTDNMDGTGAQSETPGSAIGNVTNMTQGLKEPEKLDIAVDQSKKVTLSGLLSAIDGLPDGIILIMTSNKPESLDKALLRPGRIDKQVFFGNVNKEVAKSIFVRMYQNDSTDAAPTSGSTSTRVDELGDTFASRIPDLKLTPAEVQGFLIERSGEPEAAIADVDQWVSNVLAAKEAGTNIVVSTVEQPTASTVEQTTAKPPLLKRIFGAK